jgi:hypothetical protein
MTPTTKVFLGVALAAAGVGVVLAAREPIDSAREDLPDGGRLVRDAGEENAGRLLDSGVSLSYRVYAVTGPDGGVRPYAEFDDGGGVLLDVFPCAKKAAATPLARCQLSRNRLVGGRDGGRDPGAENVMQPGQWVGDLCVRTPCAVMAGDTPP